MKRGRKENCENPRPRSSRGSFSNDSVVVRVAKFSAKSTYSYSRGRFRSAIRIPRTVRNSVRRSADRQETSTLARLINALSLMEPPRSAAYPFNYPRERELSRRLYEFVIPDKCLPSVCIALSVRVHDVATTTTTTTTTRANPLSQTRISPIN